MTKLAQFCERSIEAGWLLSLGLIPLYINFFSIRGYTVGKAYLLRTIVLLMAAAWLMKLWEERGLSDAFRGEPQGRTLARVVKNPLSLPVTAYVFALLLSTATSVAPGLSFHGSFDRLQGTFTTLIYIAFFILIALHLRTREQFAGIVTVLLLASIPISLYALAQQWLGDPFSYIGPKSDLKWPARSTMGHHIFLGAYLIMLIPWTAARLIEATLKWTSVSSVEPRQGSPSGSRGRSALIFGAGGIVLMNLALAAFIVLSSSMPGLRWIVLPVLVCYLFFAIRTTFLDTRAVPPVALVAGYGCLLLLQAIALAITQARGPWIGALVGGGLFALLIAFSWRSWRLLAGVLACTAAVMLFVALLNIPKGPLEPLKRHAILNRLGSLSDFESPSISYRLRVWSSVGQLLWSRPEIGPSALSGLRPGLGYGPETFALVIERVLPQKFDPKGNWKIHDRAHNDVMHHLVEGGILGFGTFLWLVGVWYWITLKALWRSQDHSQKLALAALIGSVSSHLIELQFSLGITPTRMLFWLSLALSLFLSRPPPSDGIKGPKKGSPKRSRMILYILLVLLLALALATKLEITTIEAGVFLGFGGMFLGMALMALDLAPLRVREKLPGGKLWRLVLILSLAAILIFLGALRPIIADSYYRFGRVEGRGNDLEATIFAYQGSITWEPREENYHRALGLTLVDLGLTMLEKRPDLKPPPGFKADTSPARTLTPRQIVQLGGEGVLALAEASLMEANRLLPLDPLGLFHLAQLNHEWGLKAEPQRLEKALNYYSEAHKISPNRISILLPWAMLYLAKNDLNRALELIQTAQSLGADPALIEKALAKIKQHKFFP